MTTEQRKAQPQWKRYETVAQYLLNEFASEFGLTRVEGKQHVRGQSGASWEIDLKGVREGDAGFVVGECRRWTTSKLSQGRIASLAWQITDTGAVGGITVSPFDLQRGAKKVAAAANVVHFKLTPESTTKDYVVAFLDQVFVGISAEIKMNIVPRASIKVFDEAGKLIEERDFD